MESAGVVTNENKTMEYSMGLAEELRAAHLQRQKNFAAQAAKLEANRSPSIAQSRIGVDDHETPSPKSAVIIRAVALQTGITLQRMRSRRRDKATAHARGLASYLCREIAHATWRVIARDLGMRNHANAVVRAQELERRLAKDGAVKAEVAAIKRKIDSMWTEFLRSRQEAAA